MKLTKLHVFHIALAKESFIFIILKDARSVVRINQKEMNTGSLFYLWISATM